MSVVTANLKTTLLGTELRNPTILAAGFLGVSAESLIRVYENGAGAVTTKSISIESRNGHANPTVLSFGHGLINAVGLSNPGIDNYIEEIKTVKEKKIPLILNTIGDRNEDFITVAKLGEAAGVDIIELNVSCPNVIHKKPYYSDPELLSSLVRNVKDAVSIPVIVKLSPNVTDIKEIAKAVEDAGADGISAINTVGPGMIINIETAKPVMAFKKGGLSGPAIKPVAIRCVYDIYETVDIPVIGIGGIMNGKATVEMIMAGASAVGIGSAIYYRGLDVFKKISEELSEWMDNNGYTSIKQLVGAAHES
ncbi:MAG: dihydroorotate dehydrogenase B catalytic subunit [Candidatus Aenigmarchaeota archaeon ex4484_14]|nr:MAG: dihydroorotate dehydrogenase B catalytic subunit [Candidatus Aenigmarchaeota archaeon ex4484_14]